jgi:Holliday junction DNA helicase RuvB
VGRLLRRVRDFAHVAGSEVITQTIADNALTRLEVNAGLDAQDRRYLHMIADIYKGGPVGPIRWPRACRNRVTRLRK